MEKLRLHYPTRNGLVATVTTLALLFGSACSQDREPQIDLSATPGDSDRGNGFQPVITVQASDAQLSESDAGASTLSFNLALSAQAQSRIQISYVTVDGSARAGTDYQYSKGMVEFERGEQQKSVSVEVFDDSIDENSERLTLQLHSPNAQLMATSVIGTIEDDDDPPALSIVNASVSEGNADLQPLTFDIALNTASGKYVSVEYSTNDADASAADDYIQTSGRLVFRPGDLTKSVTVWVVGDTVEEANEQFDLQLSNVSNATLSETLGTGEILNDDPVSGIPQRPTNISCTAPDQPTINTSVANSAVFGGAGTFVQPILLTLPPNDSSTWYLAEQRGRIYRFDNDPAVASRDLFVDIEDRVNDNYNESGLLGFAFHPDFPTNNSVYVSYTASGPGAPYNLTSRLSRFESNDGGLTLDPDSEVILMSQDQRYNNHNGGHIEFGPDGYLYFGLGDAGSSGDPDNRAQNTKNLFGAMLRIDIDSGSPYSIPSDNPFHGNALCSVSTTGSDSLTDCPEIYAWGLRNPWRWSFDGDTGTLWLGDVGQNNWEEVDVIELGGNYGWRVQEGDVCFKPPSGCDTADFVQPIVTYNHSVGQSITGGRVYRGGDIPELAGRYVFADYVAGKLFALTSTGDGSFSYEQLADTSFFISHIADDQNGELYFLDYGGGSIRMVTQFGGISNDTIPALLSDSGCVGPGDIAIPADNLIPYDVNTPFWSDGSDRTRFMALPEGLTVDVDIDGDWQLPTGTVLVKNFRLFDKLVETRHLMRHTNGEWAGYTYEWNDDETEATRVVGGKTKSINGQTWIFPSETQCMQCHTSAAGFSLGLENLQINRDLQYPSTGITASQLYTVDFIDVLTNPLPDSPERMASLSGIAGAGYFLNFASLATDSYSNQDSDSSVSVEDSGATLRLDDNTQRRSVDVYNITPETVLSFDFESTAEAEIHGIGFDENNSHNDDLRVFQLFGIQSWVGNFQEFATYSGSGRQHFEIPVGRFYTGNAMNLVFVNDDDAGVGGNSMFSNVRVLNCPGCLDFNVLSTSSFSNQDGDSNVSVADDGATLVLADNTWRRTNQIFEITPNTYITFEFESTLEGEIHSIGFDENDEWNDATRMFRLYGNQSNGDFTDYETYVGPGREQFQIPVGRYYTGSAMRMVFANDDDGGAGSDGRFSNVKVIECPDCIDFRAFPTSSYADQDVSGSVSVETVGFSIVLTNNTWRQSDQTFEIFPDTVLEFDYESTAEGGVQGIGFDENSDPNDDVRIFKVFGTESNFEFPDFDDYKGSGRLRYRIPVGQYYTGSSMRLVFVNDDDIGVGSQSKFSNVRIHSQPVGPSPTPTMADQVRSYLHVNCSGCHRPGGPTTSNMDLRFNTPWQAMNACDVVPTTDGLGLPNAKLIAPGNAARSLIVERMQRRDAHGMPPLGSTLVDTAGVDLLTTWIDGLSACPK